MFTDCRGEVDRLYVLFFHWIDAKDKNVAKLRYIHTFSTVYFPFQVMYDSPCCLRFGLKKEKEKISRSSLLLRFVYRERQKEFVVATNVPT